MAAIPGLRQMVTQQVLSACGRSAGRFVALPRLSPLAQRPFASAATTKLAKVLQAELKHEEEDYVQPQEIKGFLNKSSWKLVETPGDVNLMLEREVSGNVVRVEWQLSSPFDPEADEEGEEGETADAVSTDLSITVENKSGAGLCFYCCTQSGEDHRYVIGNVKSFSNAEEKDAASGFHGPEFEDLDDKLQEAFDEHLAELGMSNELCDFVDAMASDKEAREYNNWLKATKKILE